MANYLVECDAIVHRHIKADNPRAAVLKFLRVLDKKTGSLRLLVVHGFGIIPKVPSESVAAEMKVTDYTDYPGTRPEDPGIEILRIKSLPRNAEKKSDSGHDEQGDQAP